MRQASLISTTHLNQPFPFPSSHNICRVPPNLWWNSLIFKNHFWKAIKPRNMTMWATSSYFMPDDTGSFHFKTSPTLKEVKRRGVGGGEKGKGDRDVKSWKKQEFPPSFHTTPVPVRCTGENSDPAPRCSLVGDFSAFTGLNAKGVKRSYSGLTPLERRGEFAGQWGVLTWWHLPTAWQDLSPGAGEGSPNTPQTSPWLEPADWIRFSNTGRILSWLGGSCYPKGCKN